MRTDSIFRSLPDRNTISISVDPSNGKHAFVGTRGSGLLEYGENGIENVYNQNNSTIMPINDGSGLTWIGGVDYDSDGNLWVLSNLNSGQLAERTAGGAWKSYNFGATYNGFYLFNLLADSYQIGRAHV